MTTYYYPSYMAMSESKLNRHLIKRKYPDELRHTIVELIGKQRRHRANERRKRGQLTPLWDHLMLPLSGEIRNTHAMLRYTARDTERDEARRAALNAYLTVTTTLYDRFKELRRANEKSPLRIAKEKDPPLPNGGEHWTDWIPDHIRARTLALFDAIPPMRYAKTKKPFARVMPPDVHAKLKPRIAQRLNSDLAVLETDLMLMELNPTSEGFDNDEEKNQALLAQRARVDRARKARDILDAMPETEALPVTWHGIIVE